MKIYISGKVTGEDPQECEKKFNNAAEYLKSKGHTPINPYSILKDSGLGYEDFMWVCFRLIDLCDVIYMLRDYKQSSGAMRELAYAGATNKYQSLEAENE